MLDLTIAASAIFVVGAAYLAANGLSPFLAMCLALFKAICFGVYYGALFDGTYTFKDDITYYHSAIVISSNLHHYLWGPGLSDLFSIAEGPHIAYYLLDAAAIKIFGQHYYSGPALNVLLTFPAIVFAAKMLSISDGGRATPSTTVIILGILSPTILAWSTVVNNKDTLIFLLETAAFLNISRILSGRDGDHIKVALKIAIVLFVLTFTRYYSVPLIGLAFLLGLLIQRRISARTILIYVVLPSIVFWEVFLKGRMGYLSHHQFTHLSLSARGVFHFLLTPIPGNEQVAYSFLFFSDVANWIWLVPVIWTLFSKRRKSNVWQFFLITFLVFVAFYGAFSELNGPRHRYQIFSIYLVCVASIVDYNRKRRLRGV